MSILHGACTENIGIPDTALMIRTVSLLGCSELDILAKGAFMNDAMTEHLMLFRYRK
jgi:hypothetical protein